MCLGTLRFTELQRHLPGLSGKVLSNNLKDLEIKKLVKREVHDTFPVTVEYALTDYGRTLEPVVNALREWGLKNWDKLFDQ